MFGLSKIFPSIFGKGVAITPFECDRYSNGSCLPELRITEAVPENWLSRLDAALENRDIRTDIFSRATAFSEVIEDGFVTLDDDGAVLSANAKACELLGLEIQDILGKSREDLPLRIPFFEQDFEIELNGKYISVCVHEREGRSFAIFKDLTEQELIKKTLSKAEETSNILRAVSLLAQKALDADMVDVDAFVKDMMSDIGVASGLSAAAFIRIQSEAHKVVQWSDNANGDHFSVHLSELFKEPVRAIKHLTPLLGPVFGLDSKVLPGVNLLFPVRVSGSTEGILVFNGPPGYQFDDQKVEALHIGACVLSSILARKDLEAKMKENERFIESLSKSLDQLSDPVLISDHCGKIVFVNTAFQFKFGYRLEEVKGMTYEDLLADESAATYRELVKDVTSRGMQWRGTLSGLSSAGEKIAAVMSISPIRAAGLKVTNYFLTTMTAEGTLNVA